MNEILTINRHEIQALSDCFQVREKMKPCVVYDYRVKYQNGVDMPPIVVARLKGVYYLCDGFHRLAALLEIGRESLSVEVIDVKNEHDIRWQAAMLNGQHGLQLTNKEKHIAFDYFIKAKKHIKNKRYLSIREIAKEFGMWNQSTVNRVLKAKYPAIFSKLRRESYINDGRDRSRLWEGNTQSLTQQTLTDLEHVFASIPALHWQGRKQVIKALKACIDNAENVENGEKPVPIEEADKIKLFMDDEDNTKVNAVIRAENEDF